MESTDTLTRSRVTDLADLADGALLSEATEIEALLREAEVHKLRLAYQWAIAHPALDACETPSGPALPSVLTAPETLGGAGTPAVAAFTPEPLAVALGCSPASASTLIADALDLHHRLPLLWDQTRCPARAGVEGATRRHPHPSPVRRGGTLGRPPGRGAGLLPEPSCSRPCRRRGRRTLRRGGAG